MPTAFRRRRGHRETPTVVGLFWIPCTLGVGATAVVCDSKLAERIGATVDAVRKWAELGRG